MFVRSALTTITLAILVAACGGGGDSEEAGTSTDAVEITSVTPTTAAADTSITFVVTFNYRLSSVPTGVVNLGFFTDPDSQRLTPQELRVLRGAGTGTLSATIAPTSYTRTTDFAVGVLLSEDPHPLPWTPLARAKQHIPLLP